MRYIAIWPVILGLACMAGASRPGLSQAPAPPPAQKQTDQPKPAPNPPAQANPFPEDDNNVPVLPSGNPAIPSPPAADSGPPPALPPDDMDPVRSPDDPVNSTASTSSDSSSSLADMDKLLEPPPDEDTRKGKKGKDLAPPEHQETAKEDESVGSLYLDQHDWKGALSRFESAVVLDPENPDVYWGLAEAERHMGRFAEAKANYQKVMDYDPGSRHAKDAKKLLKEPELANAAPPK